MKKVLTAFILLHLNFYSFASEVWEKRIAGGRLAREGQFPFFVQIEVPELMYEDNKKQHIQMEARFRGCGASLIHRKWILTSAHFFPDNQSRIEELETKKLCMSYFGSNKAFHNSAVKIPVIKILLHPQYNQQKSPNGGITLLINDIALLKMKKKVTLSSYIQPVVLPSNIYRNKNDHRCKVGTILGIGDSDILGTQSDHLLYANVASKNRAEVSLPMLTSNTVFFSEAHVDKGHAMRGDFGGPYVCYKPFRNKMTPTQYGLISYIRINNERRTVITAYEDVTRHLSFILEYVPVVTKENKNNRIGNVKTAQEGKSNSKPKIKTSSFIVFLCFGMFVINK